VRHDRRGRRRPHRADRPRRGGTARGGSSLSRPLRIVVTGLIAQHPRLGGVAWDYLQYPAGLARLGHDVYYLEDSGEWPYTENGGADAGSWVARDPRANVEHVATTLARFGLADRWMYRFPIDGRWYGLPDRRRREVLAGADLLLNVSGTLERPAEYRAIPRLAYIDSDPVFTQVKLALDGGRNAFRERIDHHDVLFSFGERIGSTEYANGRKWRPTRQPVLLSEWRPQRATRDVLTTVMSWTSYRPLRHAGKVYGQKDVELRRFIDLPAAVAPARLEVALGGVIHAEWETHARRTNGTATPAERLRAAGWRVADAGSVASSVDGYRRYVRSSKAELSVAKHGYVAGRAGWFSCRSACYLAAGRPAIVQDTGFSDVIPSGEGVVAFGTTDEAADAVREVGAHYERHARAARELAHEFFDSDRVLAKLVDEATSTDG
jgi:hypothetical protein